MRPLEHVDAVDAPAHLERLRAELERDRAELEPLHGAVGRARLELAERHLGERGHGRRSQPSLLDAVEDAAAWPASGLATNVG
ncbi:MAG: hypothetical protein R3F59_16955 [Myxococcota bacterium]